MNESAKSDVTQDRLPITSFCRFIWVVTKTPWNLSPKEGVRWTTINEKSQVFIDRYIRQVQIVNSSCLLFLSHKIRENESSLHLVIENLIYTTRNWWMTRIQSRRIVRDDIQLVHKWVDRDTTAADHQFRCRYNRVRKVWRGTGPGSVGSTAVVSSLWRKVKSSRPWRSKGSKDDYFSIVGK